MPINRRVAKSNLATRRFLIFCYEVGIGVMLISVGFLFWPYDELDGFTAFISQCVSGLGIKCK